MNVGAGIVRHVRNPAVLPDKEADAAGHVFVGHSGAILVGNLPVGVHEQGEVEAVFVDEFFVAFTVVEAHAEHLDIVLLQVGHAVAQTARLLGAAGGVIFGIEVKQCDLFSREVRQYQVLPSWSLASKSGALSPTLGASARLAAAESRNASAPTLKTQGKVELLSVSASFVSPKSDEGGWLGVKICRARGVVLMHCLWH